MGKKNVLVFGGSGGIGQEITKVFKKDKMNVGVVGRGQVRTDCDKGGMECGNHFFKIDLKSEKSIRNGFIEIDKKFDKIDVVVYSVSSEIKNKNILNMSWEEMTDHLDIQVKGIFKIVSFLKEKIIKKEGIKFVIILSEVCIGRPPTSTAHYVTAKYALMGLSKSLAVDLSKYNCTVNMVSPGMVDTNLLSNLPPKLIEIVAEKNPQKRIAEPADVARVVKFLASEDSSYLNGVNIVIDGGNMMV